MPDETNPYQAPSDLKSNETVDAEESLLWIIGFWIAACFAVLGIFAMFIRNLPPSGFFLVAMILFAAVSFGSCKVRKRAIAGFFVCLLMSLLAFAQYRAIRAQAALERARQMRAMAVEAAERAARRAAESKFSEKK